MEAAFNFQPVVIIGAARSGTNMLRDSLTQMAGVGTWPCDEINYIWRHGHRDVVHDEFSATDAHPAISGYIRNAFARQARARSCSFLVEKTCANSLRVDFVDAIIPEAKYIFLVRDGRDVVVSALKRWTAPLDVGYLMKKLRYVPPSDLFFYGTRYLANRLYRLRSSERRVRSWGPRFREIDSCLRNHSLFEVCALQWSRSVDAADCALQKRSSPVFQIRYEDFVSAPEESFGRLLEFLGIEATAKEKSAAVSGVSAHRVGTWKRHLKPDQLERIERLVRPTLTRFGYRAAAIKESHRRAA